jgi:hypothetical protein
MKPRGKRAPKFNQTSSGSVHLTETRYGMKLPERGGERGTEKERGRSF